MFMSCYSNNDVKIVEFIEATNKHGKHRKHSETMSNASDSHEARASDRWNDLEFHTIIGGLGGEPLASYEARVVGERMWLAGSSLCTVTHIILHVERSCGFYVVSYRRQIGIR